MSRLFGWSYPPGAASDPNAPYNQNGPYICEVCLCDAEVDCRCPECPECGEVGNPRCYESAIDHPLFPGSGGGCGLVLDPEVKIGRRGREFLMAVNDMLDSQADEMYAREFDGHEYD